MTINPLTRTTIAVIETSLLWFPSFDKARGKRAFQFVKFVTGKSKSSHTDYEILTSQHYGYDTITISGNRGFIRLSLEPLFELID